jgi:Cu-Zn family superoxide dismutase
MFHPHRLAPLSVAVLLLAACTNLTGDGSSMADGPSAHARIEGRSGSALSGTATFVETASGVIVDVQVVGAPGGWHAVHVHQVGDCSAEDGTSAGGHFNPDGVIHGSPDAAEHHAGDLGNMWVDENGIGRKVILMPELTVSPGTHSVVGRSIIVHAGADDLVSQPTGGAGGRIGCGEIQS